MVERGDDKHGLKKVPVEMVELVWDIQRWFKRLRAHTQESFCKTWMGEGYSLLEQQDFEYVQFWH